MPAEYDPDILQQYADALYSRAKWIVITSTAQWGIVTWFAVGVAISLLHPSTIDMSAAAIAGAIGALVGYQIGSGRAFRLKLEAQTALCQREIEKNTRGEHPVNRLRDLVESAQQSQSRTP